MIAVDTNILVYSYRADSPHHQKAHTTINDLANSGLPWAICWPTIHEFLAIVTHRKIYDPPTPTTQALRAIDALTATPTLHLLGESAQHLEILHSLIQSGSIIGPKIHDARIAAICLGHGVSQLYTADRDFSYFPQLKTRNPLVG